MLQIEIIGNIGQDAVIKEIGGKRYVSFSVAHSEKRNGNNGVPVESTTWVDVLWYGEGGALVQYLKRGAKVFVRGRMSVSVYQARSGQYVPSVSAYATEVQLCGIKENEAPATAAAAPTTSAVPADNDPNSRQPF